MFDEWHKTAIGMVIALLVTIAVNIVLMYNHTPYNEIAEGILSFSLAIAVVHIFAYLDDRWSLYVQIIEEKNMAFAVAYSGWIIGACIAFPYTIL